MSEFIKIGRRRISVDSVRAIDAPANDSGEFILHYNSGQCEPLSKEDGEALLAWVDSHLITLPKTPPAPKGKVTA